jgi:hypothetical protein
MAMHIEIDDRHLKFDDQCLTYSSYYFDKEEYEHLTNGEVLKKIFVQWAEALARLDNEDGMLFLPFNLDDEWVDCFKVICRNGKLLFKNVRVDENGWALDVRDLNSFMTSSHKVLKESNQTYGEHDKEEVIKAVSEAKVTENSGCAAQDSG